MTQETPIHQQDEFTLEEKVKYGILGVILLGGSFFIGRKLVRRAKSYSEEKKTYEEGNEATYAKQLKMAFENDMWFGWGTDEEAIRKVLRAVPSKEYFRRVINSYQKLYSRSLMKDMQDELTSTEYSEMLAIIGAKPERGNVLKPPVLTAAQYLSWAKRLKAAFTITYGPFPGTDEDAVKAVFLEIPTQAAFAQVIAAYKKEYDDELMSDLKDELTIFEFVTMMNIITKKPKV
ncbi:MAG TPA: hypothetical protein PKA77_17965 [Chitinophagaceae bacterium]|jgi:hypothetical protein|nr:hypothetical protein [Bacteroidota bacterium]HMT75965.1 hypothetical protein [Chitinophagaceae bacterium]HMU60087.1 hypothetical protein [Chitinophagaceae bacterium]